jgi:CrcB protein
MWQSWLWVALGGAMGASSRYGVSLLMSRWLGSSFPWGTFSVNMLGSLVMGAVFALFSAKWMTTPAHTLIAVGFLGSFTTFSSFALDQMKLLQEGHNTAWIFNLLVQNCLGLFLVWLGWKGVSFLLQA